MLARRLSLSGSGSATAVMRFEPPNLQHNWPLMDTAIEVTEGRVNVTSSTGLENAVAAVRVTESNEERVSP